MGDTSQQFKPPTDHFQLVLRYISKHDGVCLLSYRNSIAEYLVTKLQRVQNCAARIVLNLRKYDTITPALIKLHWLPVKQRIIYKVLVTVFKALKGDAPSYISSMLTMHTPNRNLRSSQKKYILEKPRSKLKRMGDRCFEDAAPRHWNSLPDFLRDIKPNISYFKKQLKTYLFLISFPEESIDD